MFTSCACPAWRLRRYGAARNEAARQDFTSRAGTLRFTLVAEPKGPARDGVHPDHHRYPRRRSVAERPGSPRYHGGDAGRADESADCDGCRQGTVAADRASHGGNRRDGGGYPRQLTPPGVVAPAAVAVPTCATCATTGDTMPTL